MFSLSMDSRPDDLPALYFANTEVLVLARRLALCTASHALSVLWNRILGNKLGVG
jgi:hypothetical protein